MDKLKNKSARSDLMEALCFSHEDLLANRAGKLSDGQRHELQRAGCGYHLLYALSTVAMVIVTAMVTFGNVEPPITPAMLISIGMTALVLAGWYQTYRYYENVRADDSVTILRGVIGKYVVSPDRKSIAPLRLLIGDEEFEVRSTIFNAFTENTEYLLYVAPNRHEILSAEPAMLES